MTGVPDWAIAPLVNASSSKFPSPLPVTMQFDPVSGYPLLNTCLAHDFGDYYFSGGVSGAFQALYDNTGGLADALAGMWAAVAARFAQNPFVLGYELINEPFMGMMRSAQAHTHAHTSTRTARQ